MTALAGVGVRRMSADVLVLGGGMAGTRAALAARRAGRRVAWAYLARGASPYIIGANVPLGSDGSGDDAGQYAADMREGGYGLGEPDLVRALADHAVPAFGELVGDVEGFARDGDAYRLRHLSGNRHPRSVYVPEGTGRAVLRGLDAALADAGVTTLAGHKVLSLLPAGEGVEGVCGALLLSRHGEELLAVEAQVTILALGGIGRLYGDTTYPSDVAGDAAILALEAGATLIDMEFVQFEPVVTYTPEGTRGMEMPTAMLGDGAQLLNACGERFMLRYNPGGGERGIEKARMALCIRQEIDEGRGFAGGTVRFDTTTVPPERLESYVSHCRRLRRSGCEPLSEGPLVRPAAHSVMGGIRADAQGFTGVPGLFVCGEAMGGIHGASRIAGNGGGETMTMGWVVGRAAAQAPEGQRAPAGACPAGPALARLWPDVPAAAATHAMAPEAIGAEIRAVMDECAGLFRTAAGLTEGLARIARLDRAAAVLARDTLAEAVAARSCRNLARLAHIVLEAALLRTESRGAHQRRDFPATSDADWLRHVCVRQAPGGGLSFEPSSRIAKDHENNVSQTA